MLFKKDKQKLSKKEKAVRTFKAGFGTKAHKAGWSLIRTFPETIKQQATGGEDPHELKALTFDELLDRWQIPREKVSYLKKMLLLEIIAYLLLTVLGFSNLAYKLFSPDYSITAAILGTLVGAAAFLQLLLRHHWFLILSRQKYLTFKEYLFGLFNKGE
ncbi:MAG: hypothetical protein ACLFRO_09130 [Desulfobacterales bacterium]